MSALGNVESCSTFLIRYVAGAGAVCCSLNNISFHATSTISVDILLSAGHVPRMSSISPPAPSVAIPKPSPRLPALGSVLGARSSLLPAGARRSEPQLSGPSATPLRRLRLRALSSPAAPLRRLQTARPDSRCAKLGNSDASPLRKRIKVHSGRSEGRKEAYLGVWGLSNRLEQTRVLGGRYFS